MSLCMADDYGDETKVKVTALCTILYVRTYNKLIKHLFPTDEKLVKTMSWVTYVTQCDDV